MKAEEIAQWVIDNRLQKNENDKISDSEMYNFLVENIEKLCDKKIEKCCHNVGVLEGWEHCYICTFDKCQYWK